MTDVPAKPEQFLVRSVIPILCSFAAGLLFYQGEIFEQTHPAFQFVWSALVMSLFYNLRRDVRPRDAYLGLMVLGLLTVVSTRSTQWTYLLRDLLYVAGMGASVVLYARYYTKATVVPTLASACTFAGLYGMVCVLATSCNAVLLELFAAEGAHVTFRQIASSASSFGMLIGFAVGAGFDIAERFPRPAERGGAPLPEGAGDLHVGR